MTAYVVDASTAVKLYLAEPLAAEAAALFALLSSNPPADFHVPDLFYVERANIFWKQVRKWTLTAAEAALYDANLHGMPLLRTPTYDLTSTALPIATAHDITVYDACYVALADRLAVPSAPPTRSSKRSWPARPTRRFGSAHGRRPAHEQATAGDTVEASTRSPATNSSCREQEAFPLPDSAFHEASILGRGTTVCARNPNRRSAMTVRQLAAQLVNLGIPPSWYSLTGGLPAEAYAIEKSGDHWLVYYSEHGERTGLKSFSTEEQACDYLLEELKRAKK